MIDAETRRRVRLRAGNACEYCGLTQAHSPFARLHIDHVRPRKHGGDDSIENLALACIDCNSAKGSNFAGFDPESDQPIHLYNPRTDRWNSHFRWNGIQIVGLTPVGRTTVHVLRMNSEEQLQLRLEVQAEPSVDQPDDTKGFSKAIRRCESQPKQRVDLALIEFRRVFAQMSTQDRNELWEWAVSAEELKQNRPKGGPLHINVSVKLLESVDDADGTQFELTPLAIQRAIEHWNRGEDYSPTSLAELL